MHDKNGNMMPFTSLLSGPPPIDMNNMLSFGPGPMKPPPLLFSQTDHISILPLINSIYSVIPETKKHTQYSEEFMFTLKDK